MNIEFFTKRSVLVISITFIGIISTGFTIFDNNKHPNTQNKAPILKVSYEQEPESAEVLNFFKAALPPEVYNKAFNTPKKTKFYFSLYINPNTNESLLIQDSIIHLGANQQPFSYTYAVWQDKEGKYKQSEQIMQNKFYSQSTPEDYSWTIGTEHKTIANMEAVSATLNNDPYKEGKVWITTNISAATGPDYYQNAPGLILESENLMGSIKAVNISPL